MKREGKKRYKEGGDGEGNRRYAIWVEKWGIVGSLYMLDKELGKGMGLHGPCVHHGRAQQ